MDEITVGVMLPHELFHNFYVHEQGQFFYMFFAGVPGVPWHLKCLAL